MDLSVGTLDARGRVLEEGDEIILNAKGVIYFRVAKISPSLDPRAPADLLLVHLIAVIPFMAGRGKVNPEFIRVRTLAEAGPLPFNVDLTPPPTPPNPS